MSRKKAAMSGDTAQDKGQLGRITSPGDDELVAMATKTIGKGVVWLSFHFLSISFCFLL